MLFIDASKGRENRFFMEKKELSIFSVMEPGSACIIVLFLLDGAEGMTMGSSLKGICQQI